MRQLFRNLPRQSYQASFLWKTALLLVALGIGIGFAIHQLAPANDLSEELNQLYSVDGEDDAEMPPDNPDALKQKEDSTFSKMLDEWAMETRVRMINVVLTEVANSKFTNDQKDIARLMLESIRIGGDPMPELVALTNETPPVPDSNQAIGAFWLSQGYYFQAANAYEREATISGSKYARENVIGIYWSRQAYSQLIRLLDEPEYRELLMDDLPYLLLKEAIQEKDWPEIIKRTIINDYDFQVWQIVLITLLVGLAWFAFLMHAARLWKKPSSIGLCVLAVLLGAFSATATILMIILQEDFLGFTEKNDLLGGLLYCVGGIGLREEFLKLLFYTPLLPLLAKRKDPLLALIVAGCVGLGFAIQENIGYFHASVAFSGPGRFLTANFFHISATALTGYALYRVVVLKWRALDYFASMFGMIVIAHGLYDAFIMVPELADYSFLSMTIYVLLCFQMFQILDEIQPKGHRKISLSFIFTISLSCVLAICLGWSASLLGYSGIRLVGADIIGLGVVVIMFFRVINEPIHH